MKGDVKTEDELKFSIQKSSYFNEDRFVEAVVVYHKTKEIQNDLTVFVCASDKRI